jgi:hypothetical protein
MLAEKLFHWHASHESEIDAIGTKNWMGKARGKRDVRLLATDYKYQTHADAVDLEEDP